MGIDSNSVGVGQQASPNVKTCGALGKCDECTLAFPNTGDFTDNLVGFQVAGVLTSIESNGSTE